MSNKLLLTPCSSCFRQVPKGRTRIGATLVIPPQPLPLLPKALDSPSKGTSNLFHTYVLIVPTFEDHDHALSPNHHPSAMIRNDRGNRLLSQDDLFEDAGAEPRLESISLTPRNIPSLKSMSQLLSGPQPQSGSKSQSGPQELTGCLVDISMGVLVKRIQIRSSSLAAFSPGHNSILALASPSALSTITLLNTRQGNEICHLVVKSPTTTAAIELDGEFTPDGIITSFSFSPRGQFVAAQISSADPAVDFKTNDGVGKDKPARSWLYLWRVKGEAQEYEEEKFDQVGNPIHASFETPIW